MTVPTTHATVLTQLCLVIVCRPLQCVGEGCAGLLKHLYWARHMVDLHVHAEGVQALHL